MRQVIHLSLSSRAKHVCKIIRYFIITSSIASNAIAKQNRDNDAYLLILGPERRDSWLS